MDAEKKAREAADTVCESMHDAVDTAKRAADKIEQKGEKFIENQERMIGECRGFVRENPMTSLVIAAGVGYIISKLTR